MKKYGLFLLFLFCFAYAQTAAFDPDSTDFFLDTKIMEDGSIVNIGFGLGYNDIWGGEIRGQGTKTAKNEEMDDPDIADSLIAINETVYELYLLPIQYRIKKPNLRFRAGAGLYYEYQKSNEKGFVDMPFLEDQGLERVNLILSDFTMHIAGPLLDAGVKYDSDLFSVSFSAGIVPVFFLNASEKYSMYPLIPQTEENSQTTGGSPYFYLNLDSVLFRYFNLKALYNFAHLKFKVIDFDNNGSVIYPDRTVVTQSLMLEISLLIPLGAVNFQIGYGNMSNFYTLDSGDPAKNNKHYLVLSGKKIGL